MTNLAHFSQSLASEIYESPETFPVSFDDAWQWLGYSRKDVAKRAFEGCGFLTGVDFQVSRSNVENPLGGRPSDQIYLTAECLKQWGMMAGTEQGKQVRLYFLECERIAKEAVKQTTQPHLPSSYLDALKALVSAEEQKLALELKAQNQAAVISELQPKAEVAEVFLESKGNLSMQEFAQVVGLPNVGRQNMFELLKKLGFLINSKHPYQRYIDMGVFSIRYNVAPNGVSNPQVLVTKKGVEYLVQKLAEFGYRSPKIQGA